MPPETLTAEAASQVKSPPRKRTPAKGAKRVSAPLRANDHAVATIWQDGAFQRDTWATAADNEPLTDAPVILGKKRWLAEREALAGRNSPLALRLEPGEELADIADDLSRFALIALDFPKFSDGRAFSTAALLRGKYGFASELRAVGNVLSDQIPFMRRVGFDTFEVTHAPTRRALIDNRIAEVTLHYQPAAAHEPAASTRPWLRRTE